MRPPGDSLTTVFNKQKHKDHVTKPTTHIENNRLRSMINQTNCVQAVMQLQHKAGLKAPSFLKQLRRSPNINRYSFASFVKKRQIKPLQFSVYTITPTDLIYTVLCCPADKNSREPEGLCGTLRENEQPDASQHNSASPVEQSSSCPSLNVSAPSHGGNNKFLLLHLSAGT